jgi:Flp pilus assembly protein TadD
MISMNFKSVTGRLLLGVAIAQLVPVAAGVAAPAAASQQESRAAKRAAAFAGQAEAAAAAGEKWKALSLVRKAATLAPDNARYRSDLGRAYLAVNLYGSASASFGDALALNGHDRGAQAGWATAQNALGRAGAQYAAAQANPRAQYQTASAD